MLAGELVVGDRDELCLLCVKKKTDEEISVKKERKRGTRIRRIQEERAGIAVLHPHLLLISLRVPNHLAVFIVISGTKDERDLEDADRLAAQGHELLPERLRRKAE